jgi:hypothetical protein
MKLAEIQSLVKAPKSNFNSFGKYKYRSKEDILEAVKQVVNPLGYSITVTDEVILLGNRFYVKATAVLTDGKEKYEATGWAREAESKKGMDESQITGASASYAGKYALGNLFALDDTRDQDALNDHSDEWGDTIKGCKTISELTELYQQNKDQVDNDQRLKKLFAEQKTKVK